LTIIQDIEASWLFKLRRKQRFNADFLSRTSENCAEMRALALALRKYRSMTCKGSVLAVYGLQGNNATYMAPCRDRNGLWSCGSYCKQSEMTIVGPE
jgi:hypothetical protein